MQWNAHGTVERDRVTFDEGVRTSLREGTMGNGWFRVIQQTLLYVSIFDIYIPGYIYRTEIRTRHCQKTVRGQNKKC